MAAPTVVSAALSVAGTALTVVWSRAVTHVAAPTIYIAARLATLTCAYASGTTTTTLVYSVSGGTVYLNESAVIRQAAGGVTAVDDASPNAAITSQAITNASTATLAASCDGAAAGMMVNKCMVLRKTTTTSASSGATGQTWAPIYYPVCCAIQMRQSRETFAGQQETQGFTFAGYFPASLALLHGDRICTITGNGIRGLSGKILEVDGAPSDHAGRGAYLFAPLMEVPGNG
jgi:hypothetical protein